MRPGFSFAIDHRDGAARSGRLTTPHGVVDTPAFMPVATFGAVRGIAPDELEAVGAQMLLANTYHLHERPGEDIIAGQGGLHGFTGWRGPWLTDSGGFQITSMADRLRLDEQGVSFDSPLDGRRRQLTPESAVAVQESLGADVAMVLDECQPLEPSDLAAGAAASLRVRAAADRTLRWAERSAKARRRQDQALFGIVQGGADPALRRSCAAALTGLDLDGFGHGGLGLGEHRELRCELVAATHECLPAEAPRYLMGIGRPADLVAAVAAGVDLFDCVIPTRNGRHGLLFTADGPVRIRGAAFRDDARAPDPACDCPVCARHSRAYLRHLLHANESLGARLASLHNLRFYLRLLEEARRAIGEGTFDALQRRIEALDP